MGKSITLVPRDIATAVDAEKINSWLEARGDTQRLDADAFLVEISSADVSTQAEVYTGHDGEPIHYFRVEMESAGAAFGSPLVTELRKLCEEAASRFDLVVQVGKGTKDVAEFFDEGSF
ncbi:hypothetical protein HY251_09240 [bacterium]|nr:hypothetical protein [bacterium]